MQSRANMTKGKLDISQIIDLLRVPPPTYPRKAIDLAIRHYKEMRSDLLGILEKATDPSVLGENNAHVFAAFILGFFREERAHQPLLSIFRLPGELPFDVFGDVITEDGGLLLWQTAGGVVAGLKALIEDREADVYCRDAAMAALKWGVGEGVLDHATVVDYLGSLFKGDEADDEWFWIGATSILADLWPERVMPTIRRAFDQGLIGPLGLALDDVEEVLNYPKDDALSRLARETEREMTRAPHECISWWACFRSEPMKQKTGAGEVKTKSRKDKKAARKRSRDARKKSRKKRKK